MIAGDQQRELGYLSDVAHWMVGASVFNDRQLFARFSHHPQEEVEPLRAWFAQQGLIEPVG